MRKKISYYCLIIVCLVYSGVSKSEPTLSDLNNSSSSAKEKGDILLSITNLSPKSTGIIVSIYRNKEQFLKTADEVYYFPSADIPSEGVILRDITYGDFALAVTSDHNNNRVLDTKIFGIPAEPVGFANNPKSRFGPPSFEKCIVSHSSPLQKFEITLVSI